MVVRQRPIESITTEGASPSSTTRFTAVVLRCSSVLWSSNRPSIFIGLNISNTYASVDYPSDAAVRLRKEKIMQKRRAVIRVPPLKDYEQLVTAKVESAA